MDGITKIIVIDASVASAAGGRDATDVTSIVCRDLLDDIFKICHKIVVNEDIEAEWVEHASHYARLWLVRMANIGKRKLVTKTTTNRRLRYHVRKTLGRGFSYPAIRKDLPLIEVALLHDKIIISLDEKARKNLSRAAVQLEELRGIIWANPKLQGDGILIWLRKGAPDEPEQKLGHYSEHP